MTLDLLFGLLFTYLIHSTLILGLCWLIVELNWLRSAGFENRVWKYAALAGFFTATAQIHFGSPPLTKFSIDSSTNPLLHATDDGIVAQRPFDRKSKTGWAVTASLEPIESRDPNPGNKRAALTAGDEFSATKPASVLNDSPPELGQRVSYPRPRVLLVTFAILWAITGILRMSWRLSLTFLRIRRLPRANSPRLEGLIETLTLKTSWRNRVEIRIDSGPNAEPIAVGLCRWTIVLPANIGDELSDAELTAVIAHELGHLARYDYAWKLLGNLICMGAGFQPLNLLARHRWERASEYLSDQWATRHGATRIGMAKCLTKLAELRLKRSDLVAVSTTASKPDVIERVRRLVEENEETDAWQSTNRIRLIHSGSLALITIVALAAPSVTAETANEFAATAETKQLGAQKKDSRPSRVLHGSSDGNHKTLEHSSAVEDYRNAHVTSTEFESWITLDHELESLLNELRVAEELSIKVQSHTDDIGKLRILAQAIQTKRNQIRTQFGAGTEQ